MVGVLIEVLVLRRIYRAPELFQLLATFAVVLVVKDVALAVWGAEDLVGPRAPGLGGTVSILDRRVPEYDLALIVIAPLVLLALWLALAAHALGGAGARRDPGPRDGRRAGRQRGLAVHRRLLHRIGAGGPRPARCSCRASRRISGSTWR